MLKIDNLQLRWNFYDFFNLKMSNFPILLPKRTHHFGKIFVSNVIFSSWNTNQSFFRGELPVYPSLPPSFPLDLIRTTILQVHEIASFLSFSWKYFSVTRDETFVNYRAELLVCLHIYLTIKIKDATKSLKLKLYNFLNNF